MQLKYLDKEMNTSKAEVAGVVYLPKNICHKFGAGASICSFPPFAVTPQHRTEVNSPPRPV
jgi:hypothetical protein